MFESRVKGFTSNDRKSYQLTLHFVFWKNDGKKHKDTQEELDNSPHISSWEGMLLLEMSKTLNPGICRLQGRKEVNFGNLLDSNSEFDLNGVLNFRQSSEYGLCLFDQLGDIIITVGSPR